MKIIKCALSIVTALVLNACTGWTGSNTGAGTTGNFKPNYNQAYQDYLQLGARYVQAGRYDLAEPKLKRAIEIDSKPPEAWNVLALLYEQTRNIQSGNQIYQKLITSHPDYLLGYSNYATFLCKFDRQADLQSLYAKMRTRGPEFQAVSYISEGNCGREHNKIALAEAAYRQALAYDSHAPGALLPLADIALAKHNYQEAMNYLKVVHTYIGYSAESVRLAILSARGLGDANTENEMMRIMRAQYPGSPQAQSLGI